MYVIIDSNRLFAALIKDSITRKIIAQDIQDQLNIVKKRIEKLQQRIENIEKIGGK